MDLDINEVLELYKLKVAELEHENILQKAMIKVLQKNLDEVSLKGDESCGE